MPPIAARVFLVELDMQVIKKITDLVGSLQFKSDRQTGKLCASTPSIVNANRPWATFYVISFHQQPIKTRRDQPV